MTRNFNPLGAFAALVARAFAPLSDRDNTGGWGPVVTLSPRARARQSSRAPSSHTPATSIPDSAMHRAGSSQDQKSGAMQQPRGAATR